MTSIDLLHVSVPAFHPQGAFQVKGLQVQHTTLVIWVCCALIGTIRILKL